MRTKKSGGVVIFLSVFISICLTVLPWSNSIALMLPQWTLLTLVYWTIAVPHKINMGTAWLTGLFLDVLTNGLLGHNALIFSLASFFALMYYSQIRHYTPWQQAGVVLLFLLFTQSITLWIETLSTPVDISLLHWAPALSGALLWPLIFMILRYLRRTYHVN